MAIYNEQYVLEEVGRRAKLMTEELTSWAKENLLVKPGTRVEVTIQFVEEDPIDLVLKKSHDPRWVRPTEADWEEVFNLPWGARDHRKCSLSSEELITALREAKDNRNMSAKLDRGHGANAYYTVLNKFFKDHGGKFSLGPEGSLWVDRNR